MIKKPNQNVVKDIAPQVLYQGGIADTSVIMGGGNGIDSSSYLINNNSNLNNSKILITNMIGGDVP